MPERYPIQERVPLGPYPKKIEISADEMHLAYLHREATGEPIQSWIRRLIREHWDHRDPLPEDLTPLTARSRRAALRLAFQELTSPGSREPLDGRPISRALA
jgi:hypothetical protein